MTQTIHRKKRKTKQPSRFVRIIIASIFGAAILAGVIFVAVGVFRTKSSLPETPPPPAPDTLTYSETAGQYPKTQSKPTTEKNLDLALYGALAKLGAPKKELRIRKVGQIAGVGGSLIEIRAEISRAFPMSMANHIVQSAWKGAGGDIIDCIENKLGRRVTISMGFGGIATRRVVISRESKEPLVGTVSLVIDDFGALPIKEINGFLDLEIPFTASVLPFEEFTGEVYDALDKHDIEMIVHMPMEPESYPKDDPGKNAIFVNLPPNEIKRRVGEAIATLPKAVGMNNHMGSKATSDRKTMAAVAEALQESGLFFVDSRTSLYTCAESEARKHGIPKTRQDGNIDVVEDTSAIARRFVELALSSRESDDGMLIVGHARPKTLIAIKRVVPSLKKWGIEFIPLSELVSQRSKGE